jgi:hypothetical protein
MSQVIFRRIHGRLVPIKMSEANQERANGAAAIGSGLIVSSTTASVSSNLVHKAASALKRGKRLKSKQLSQQGFKVKALGTVAASGLIGYGANKLLSQTKYKDNEKAKVAITAGSTALGIFATESKHLKKVGYPLSTAIRDAVNIAAKAIRKGR